MHIKTAVCGLLVSPLFAAFASAASPLSDRQMDMVTGGNLTTFSCTTCGVAAVVSSSSSSMNGVTTPGSISTGSTGTGSTGDTSGNGSTVSGLPATVISLQAFLSALANAGFGPAISTH